MNHLDQKICALGGPFAAASLGAGLLLADFVPPPAPSLDAQALAEFYASRANAIRAGMIIGLLGMAGYAMLVGAISAQMQRMHGPSRLPVYLQLGAGSIGVLTVMFPVMLFAVTAFRPERDPQLTQLLNDTAWLIIIPAFPTFLAQFLAIALGIFADDQERPVFPRWAAYFNVWVGLLFIPGGFAYFFRDGPFAWDGLLAFWVAATAFFLWLLVMPWLLFRASASDQR